MRTQRENRVCCTLAAASRPHVAAIKQRAGPKTVGAAGTPSLLPTRRGRARRGTTPAHHSHPRPARSKASSRRGYVLVWYVLLLFGLMALAALVIDLGLVRLAQRQMQSAADLAAMEALRARDDPQQPPALREPVRRERAAELVSLQFDDDGVLGTDVLQLGAGPDLPLAPSSFGDPTLDGSRLLMADQAAPYKPMLQSNYPQNAPHGDMVAGSYLAGQSPAESAFYERADFAPAAADDAAMLAAPAMLVRLRRTNDFLGLDQQPGTSHAGPPLPLLFGRGGLVPARHPSEGYSLRHHGFTVRATAIAQLVPAMSVGMASPQGGVPAAAPFALTATRWDQLPAQQTSAVLLQSSGPAGAEVEGFTYDPPAAAPEGVLTFGKPLEVAVVAAVEAGTEAYVPLVESAESGSMLVWWVVAFGLARIEAWQGAGDGVLVSLVKQPEGRTAAFSNASGALLVGLPPALLADRALFDRLWASRNNVAAPLLTPVLVR